MLVVIKITIVLFPGPVFASTGLAVAVAGGVGVVEAATGALVALGAGADEGRDELATCGFAG